MSRYELGPDSMPPEDLARVLREYLESRGFKADVEQSKDTVVARAERASWKRTLSGRRLMVLVRLVRTGGKWVGEAEITDWKANLAFFLTGAILGPAGLGAATLSALSRLFGTDERRLLFDYLGSSVRDWGR